MPPLDMLSPVVVLLTGPLAQYRQVTIVLPTSLTVLPVTEYWQAPPPTSLPSAHSLYWTLLSAATALQALPNLQFSTYSLSQIEPI